MTERTFDIVFRKLAEVCAEQPAAEERPGHLELAETEIQEISEMRRMVLEITDPEPSLYTTT